jgi:hypothetical protein
MQGTIGKNLKYQDTTSAALLNAGTLQLLLRSNTIGVPLRNWLGHRERGNIPLWSSTELSYKE